MKLVDLDDHIYCGEDGDYARYNIDQNIPTIDAVPVVRCKECKHYEIDKLKKDGTDDRRYKPTYCTFLRLHLPEDWYCADGKRREDAYKE